MIIDGLWSSNTDKSDMNGVFSLVHWLILTKLLDKRRAFRDGHRGVEAAQIDASLVKSPFIMVSSLYTLL